jgi:hypothetical protein
MIKSSDTFPIQFELNYENETEKEESKYFLKISIYNGSDLSHSKDISLTEDTIDQVFGDLSLHIDKV